MPTDFEKLVWKACSRIPKGKVSTYKAIANAVGKPNAARAVGNALNKNPFVFQKRLRKNGAFGSAKNPFVPKVPCHRVIASNGSIGGYSRGLKKKIAFLKKEGIEFKNKKIDLKKFGCKI